MFRTKPIEGDLLHLRDEILSYAQDFGLTFFPVVFKVCNYDTISILAAQGGFPNRYPHWQFGMEYDQLSKGYKYGMQKIYEMVINTDPCYAYLLSANHLVDQKLVMAHVYGHADFFKNNLWFKTTDRNMMDVMANHGTKIRRYMEKYGQDKVETFIDRVLSIENLIDPGMLFTQVKNKDKTEEDTTDEYDETSQALRSFIRSKERAIKLEKMEPKTSDEVVAEIQSNELTGTKDIMLFLMKYAPLQEWEADILGILRDEAYYFLPQRLTKIMNEGWASYWHSTIMTKHALKASEVIDYADRHAGVMSMSRQQINPYRIGIELFHDIEFRWNTGRFGKEYNDCTNMQKKENWFVETNLGREKIFEVRATHNDITFIDEFFTQEFCERQQLFTYKFNPRTGRNEIASRDFKEIKEKLLNQLTNFGSPVIYVESSNFKNRGELLLEHEHHGVDLDNNYAADTLRNIYNLWKRPVNLATISEGNKTILHFDGKELKTIG